MSSCVTVITTMRHQVGKARDDRFMLVTYRSTVLLRQLPFRNQPIKVLHIGFADSDSSDNQIPNARKTAKIREPSLLWMDEILHHFKTIGNYSLLVFTRDSSFQSFTGGAGFRPSTVSLWQTRGVCEAVEAATAPVEELADMSTEELQADAVMEFTKY